jgi:hypothetical protein
MLSIRPRNRVSKNILGDWLTVVMLVSTLVVGIVSMIDTNSADADGLATTTVPNAGIPASTPTIPNIACCGGGGVNWGFDQLSRFTSSSLASVEATDGVPTFIGRYLTYGSSGFSLTSSEVSLFHGKGFGILLLAAPNQSFTNATTDANGAIVAAHSLGASPNTGIAIYRDVEQSDPVTTSYINTWYSVIEGAGYNAGFYENSFSGRFVTQFCLASSSAKSGSLLYATVLHQGSSFKEANAPGTYNPYFASCESLGQNYAWQYLTGSPVDVDEGSPSGLWW